MTNRVLLTGLILCSTFSLFSCIKSSDVVYYENKLSSDANIIISDRNIKKELTQTEASLLTEIINKSEKVGLKKIRTRYSIEIIDNQQHMILKTNGLYFSVIGTDIYYKFSKDVKYLFTENSISK